MRRRLRLPSLVFAAIVLSNSLVFGQQDTAIYQLPPIVVFGPRMPEALARIPLAVGVVDSAALNRSKGYGIDEVLGSVPGVLAQSRYGNQDVRISIRGFGARGAGERSNAGTSRGIRILLDGFPLTEPDGRT
ncbi:MAG: Plug domain-containing protein, partial [candidate division Zixibacteria bacterium]|nr:Plug domain-containing protein [candidate division Zixibacteria bacterium]